MRARSLLALLPLLAVAMGFAACQPGASQAPVDLDLGSQALTAIERPVDYEADVKPVLERRCIVCHACYDAPCQLLLSSYEGAHRGASKTPVYDSSRLTAESPTRMFFDAQSTGQWRAKGFFPVLGAAGAAGASEAGSDASRTLLYMLALGRVHPFAENARLPAEVGLAIDRPLTCPMESEFDAYAREHPLGGMPYGMAPLHDDELRVLASWALQSPPPPKTSALPPSAQAQLDQWEAFLNGPSLKEQITARYLYEHWFVAHLVLDGFPSGPFLEIVRSRTPPGEPIDVIATVRPYDDPGVERPYYRLRRVASTIVHKTHITYPLGDAKLRRLRSLFLQASWQPTHKPGYSADEASNPFIAFDQIPAASRYAFLLDDAQYFVMTFIRGPVCRGQVAVDVIEDQFWLAFVDPAHDVSVRDPKFLERTKDLLSLPSEHGGRIVPGTLWLEFNAMQRRYLEKRADLYDELDPQRRGPSLAWVWDGGRTNTNALLTVFRNFDNAEVVRGFVGEVPKTAWIMDYPIFERIYYNLVAGFDIYGNVAHQISTRLYMDHLRMQSENLFLGLLPANQREAMRASWYVGATRQVSYAITDKLRALDHGTQVVYRTSDVKAEALEMIRAHAGPAAGPPDLLNRCAKAPCDRPGASAVERSVERELQRITAVKGEFVPLLPEVTFLRVRVGPNGTGADDLLYVLIHNAAHTNVAFMFGEDSRRLPSEDSLTIVRGHYGSYPNFIFDVDASAIGPFVEALAALRSDADLETFAGRYGVRRTSARFWATSDWLRADLARRDPTQAGIYDFGRYANL